MTGYCFKYVLSFQQFSYTVVDIKSCILFHVDGPLTGFVSSLSFLKTLSRSWAKMMRCCFIGTQEVRLQYGMRKEVSLLEHFLAVLHMVMLGTIILYLVKWWQLIGRCLLRRLFIGLPMKSLEFSLADQWKVLSSHWLTNAKSWGFRHYRIIELFCEYKNNEI